MAQPRRRPVRAVPDEQPRRRRPNGVQYYDMQMRVILGGEQMHLTTCSVCCATVPSGSKAQARHADWHRTLQEAIEQALPR